MNITHSFFNSFDTTTTNYKIEDGYLIKNNNKIMKILNIPKNDCCCYYESISSNKLFNSKIIVQFNSFDTIHQKELVKTYLRKENLFTLHFERIYILKNINKHIKPIIYSDNRFIYLKEKMLDIENLTFKKYTPIKSHFKFILISGSLSTNFTQLVCSFPNIGVIINPKIKYLVLNKFKYVNYDDSHLKHVKNLLLIDYYNSNITIPSHIENVIVFHPKILTDNSIKQYHTMFFPFMGKFNNFKHQVYCLPNKKNKLDKVVLFKFNRFEKKIFNNLSKRKKNNYSHFTDTLFINFKPLNNDYYCSICLNTIQKKNYAITKCQHEFCKKCIEHSLYYSNACPICRHPLSNEDIYIKSKKLYYLIKHSHDKTLIISNNLKTVKCLKKELKDSKIEYESFIYNYDSFTNYNKIFILEDNNYLKDYLLGMAPHSKIYTLINKK